MPLYDYACPNCKEKFELLQPVTAPTTATCPKCYTIAHRQVSSCSFTIDGGLFKNGQSVTRTGQPIRGK